MYVGPVIPFVELHNKEVIGQEQTDVCTNILIRNLIFMKKEIKCQLIEYYLNKLITPYMIIQKLK